MPTPPWTRAVILLAAALLAAAALALGIPLNEGLGRLLGLASVATVFLLALFDRWLWRYLPSSLIQRPNLNGTWQTSLTFDKDGAPSEKRCYLVIEQTYSRISVDLVSSEGCSHSTSAGLVQQGLQQVLSYSYRNEPMTLVQARSPTHRGAAALMISKSGQGVRLAGDYWTERLTKGRIETIGHNRNRILDFNTAEAAVFDPT